MAVERIDEESCTGCGRCVQSCCMDVLRMDDERQVAVIRYPQDCILCHFCERDCPVDAIVVSPHKSEPPMMSWG